MRLSANVLGRIIAAALLVSGSSAYALDSNNQKALYESLSFNNAAERELSEKVTDARIRNGFRPLVWLTHISPWHARESGLQFALYDDNSVVYRSNQSPTGFMKAQITESVKKSFIALTEKTADIPSKKSYRITGGTDQPIWGLSTWLDRASMRPKSFSIRGQIGGTSDLQTHEKLPDSVLALQQAMVSYSNKTSQIWVPSDLEVELEPKDPKLKISQPLMKWPDGLPFTVRKIFPGEDSLILKPDYNKPNKILELYKLLAGSAKTATYLSLNGRVYKASSTRFEKSMTPAQADKEFKYSQDPDDIKAEAEIKKQGMPLKRNPKADVFASTGMITLRGAKSDFDLGALFNQPPPTHLSLYCSGLSDQELLVILNNNDFCNKLEFLNLTGTDITNAVIPKLASLANSDKKLQALDLSNTRISWSGLIDFAHRAPDSKCRVCLNFAGQPSKDFRPIDSTDYAPELHMISIGEKLSTVDLLKLSQIPDLKCLIVRSAINDRDMQKVALLPRLEEIILENPRITDQSLEYLAPLKLLKRLEISRNCSSKISGATLPVFPRLEVLYLNHSPVTAAGIKRIALLPKLKNLFLNETPITDADVAPLEQMKTLEYSTFYNTKLSQHELDKLSKTNDKH